MYATLLRRGRQGPVGASEGVVVDLDPVAVGVLEVDLFDLVGADLGGGAVLGPVAVFDVHFVEVSGEGVHGGHAESQVDIDVVGDIFFGAGNDVQLAVFGDAEPDVFAVMEGLRYLFELQGFFIEVGAAVEVGYEDRLVAEMRALCAGGEGQEERGD